MTKLELYYQLYNNQSPEDKKRIDMILQQHNNINSTSTNDIIATLIQSELDAIAAAKNKATGKTGIKRVVDDIIKYAKKTNPHKPGLHYAQPLDGNDGRSIR